MHAATLEVEAGDAAEDGERVRRGVTVHDELLDEKLAFARKSTLREYAESIGVAVAIALLLRAFVVEAFQIPSGSMIPTLEIGDHIFVAKFSYGVGIPFTNTKILELKQPVRGDVIVFKYPVDPSVDYIKRVVGLPGDRIELKRNELFVNGQPVPREKVGEYEYSEGTSGFPEGYQCELWEETLGKARHQKIQCPSKPTPGFYGPTVVPPGHVFVMGDNRDNSSDSRVWGFVPHENITGRALIVWWSRAGAEDRVPWYTMPVAWAKSIRWHRFFRVVR